jgi:predicted transcriptional regulator
MLIPSQIKAARALLGLGQRELSELAGVGISTLKRIELANEITGAAQTVWKIQSALESAGVHFISADDSMGPGVRLRRVRASNGENPRTKRKAK